jgi:hypothetical protein
MVTYIWPGISVNTAGLATAAKQDEQTALLTTIENNTDGLEASLTSIDGKVATAAKQDTGNTSLASIDTKLSSQATAAKQDSIITELTTLNSKDFATETTLAALNAKVTAVNTGAVVVSSSALPTGAATEATLSTLNGKVTAVNTGAVTISTALPAGNNNIGDVDVATLPVAFNAGTASATTQRVVVATDQTAIPVSQSGTWTVQPGNTANTTAWLVAQDKSASSSVTSVSGATSSTSLLASNTSRKNASFYNDSAAILYLKLGATASTTSYTVQIPSGGYYELPVDRIYTGAIDGIWASATGAVRITELS